MPTRPDVENGSAARRVPQTQLASTFALDESKLEVPRPRPGIVMREQLLQKLLAAEPTRVLTVVAPAGYGKTTLLAQWALRRRRRAAWISVDHRDNDPAVLLTYLGAALDRVEGIEPRHFMSSPSLGVSVDDVALLVSSIATMNEPVVLVLDSVEALTNAACWDIIGELAVRMSRGSQLAIGSRRDIPLPIARLRAQGGIAEVGMSDLAMETAEADALLTRAGVGLDSPHVGTLVERTEGWPAGLYLAALAMKAGGGRDDLEFTGADRFMGDYLRSEFLDRVPRREVSFLTRTSILERLSGSVCDEIVGNQGSGQLLDSIERRNLLVIPLDRTGAWYRYHHLFRDLLHAELMRREPEIVPTLHLRAAKWYEANGMPETALDHARSAGDAEFVERLLLTIANPVWASGRLDTVLEWMEWFAASGRIDRHPAVAVHTALIYALVGRATDAERWAETAERATVTGLLPDGNTMEGTLAYLRTLLCRRGIAEMRKDAQLALDGLAPTSPYRASMLHAMAVTDLLQGDLDRADMVFAQAADEAGSGGNVPSVALFLSERGIVAVERGNWGVAKSFAERASKLVQDGQFEDYWTSALVFALHARVASQQGQVAVARERAARAARLRPLLTHALPIVSVQALLELTRAYIALADSGGAQATLRQIRDIEHHRPDLAGLSAQAEYLRARLEVIKGEIVGLSSLTTAELRLLPLLPSHLTLAQVAERLFVSPNTVKTELRSVYRKLGVSSRVETVARLRDFGLLADA